jgi:hypothetical protein
MSRSAIVIGVNKPTTLAPLQGAVADAKAFAIWAARQGFETKVFTDDAGEVTLSKIFKEVDRIVKAGTYRQAVVYFAGHGFQNGGSEVWLLSGAPNNPSEAISVEASVMASRESGLTSVVFISDACRSIPSGMQNNRVEGGSIFPNEPLNRNTRPEVDRLFATLPSLVAVEAALANDKARREGVFTREFMKGYRDPPVTFVDKLAENGQLIEVVTNRKLKERVRELVEDAAFEEMPKAGQLPEFILESIQAYVGRVERTRRPSGPIAEVAPEVSERFAVRRELRAPERTRRETLSPSVVALANQAIDAAGRRDSTGAAIAEIESVRALGIQHTVERYAGPVPVEHFETRTGFSLNGAEVVGARSPHFAADTLGNHLVRLQPEDTRAPSASVLIEFNNGNGVVLPGLRGYIGHIFVKDGLVTNVNYVPSANTDRWLEYSSQRNRVEALRATVAAAAALGVFRIEPGTAESFGDRSRILKAIDPTLGLYAAYAYASGGIDSGVRSVRDYMRDDLRAHLFDVAMLADRGVRPRETGPTPILPFCPMLRQGWALLAVREAEVPEPVRRARDWLLPALWTTFAPEGVQLLGQAIERGELG